LNTALTINGVATASDRATISVDANNIYISAPQYNNAGGGWQGTESWVIGKTVGAGGGLYNGGAMTVIANQIASPTQGYSRSRPATKAKPTARVITPRAVSSFSRCKHTTRLPTRSGRS
jgi:hypothetical protein